MLDKKRFYGLEAVIEQGARRRQSFSSHLVMAVAPAVVVTATTIFLLYLAVLTAANRTDWSNIVFAGLATAAIPAIAASLLLMMARRDNPISVAVAATIFAASFVTSFLAATRIPISFTAIALSFPMALVGTAFANVRLARALKEAVAVLDFPGVAKVKRLIGTSIPIVTLANIPPDMKRVLIDPVAHHTPEWAEDLARLHLRGIALEPWPAFIEGFQGKVDVASFDLGDLSYSPSQILYYRFKRFVDIVLILTFSIPALILSAGIWIYIQSIDRGPGIFKQERRGRGGKSFTLYKFRTMSVGTHTTVTGRADPRILPGCNILRQLRLDEIPQLLNILKGDMSIIGPRPVTVYVAEDLENRVPEYVYRQILLPGLTGWAQVHQGYAYNQEEEYEKLSYDLYYLKNVSLDIDIIIAAKTLKTIFTRTGSK